MLRYACCILMLCGSIEGSDWPRFRGADGNAAAPTANVPVTWTATENMLWTSEIPGNGASSPIAFSNRIYLTSYSGYAIDPDEPGDRANLKLHVLCFDGDGGKLIWNKSVEPSAAEQQASRRVADHGFATGTPVCDELGVYAYFGVSGVVAVDHDGNKLWEAATGDKTAGFGSAASPMLFHDLVIVNASIESSAVFAFDRRTGAEVWKIAGVERSWTTPIVGVSADGRDELVVSDKGRVRGFDPQTGKELWTCVGIQDYVVPCVVVDRSIAYVLGGRKNQSMAIRLGGTGDVTESHKIWENNIGANVTSPVYYEGRLYWASDRGIANCMDAETGESIYRERMETKDRVYASTLLAGDHLYLTTRDNGVFVIALGSEYRQVAHNVFEGDESLLNATPAVAGDRLLFRTNKKLYCIGLR